MATVRQDGNGEEKDPVDCSCPSDLLSTQAKSWIDEVILPILLQELIDDD